jgi:hypothetical protein
VTTTSPPGPTTAELFGYAAGEVHAAATALYPGDPVRLLEHVPSVTGYVQRLRVGGRPLYAKLSILGASLVSVMRGAHGTWPQVQEAQHAYAARHDCLLQREAAQLRLLADLGRPRACRVAGLHGGVLLTVPVRGQTLTSLLTTRPDQTADLLDAVLQEVESALYRQHPDRLHVVGTIERGIDHTFARKFRPGEDACIEAIGQHGSRAERRAVTALLRASVANLNRSRIIAAPAVLAYGDLKPEHVAFPSTGSPVLLDPGLRRAGGNEDLARLLSRTLLLAATQLSPDAAGAVAAGVASLVDQRLRRMRQAAADRWLREVITLWLMDTVNITSTYLTAPPALPLPDLGQAVVRQAVKVATLTHQTSSDLLMSATATVWARALERFHRTGAA